MKKLSYLFILLLFPIVAFAQEATVQDKENKEKIKEIKLSEDYVYADAVTEENLSEAQQNSMDLLRANVNAIFAERFHMSKEDVEDIWDVIEDKCQNVTIKKGDLFRVFTYIMKDYLFPGKKKKKVKNEELAEVKPSKDEILPDEIEEVSEALVMIHCRRPHKMRSWAFVPEAEPDVTSQPEPQQTQETGESKATLQDKAQEVVSEVTVIHRGCYGGSRCVTTSVATEEPDDYYGDCHSCYSSEEPIAAEPEDITVSSSSAPALDPIVKELLEIQTYKELISLLDQKKEEGTLIYGRIKTMRSPDRCYLAIFKKSEVITILGKGDKERLNLKTNTEDSLNNYKGHGVIWFQIF